MSTSSLFSRILHRKPLEVIQAEEKKEILERNLSLFDLLCIGIASTIGTGIFSTAGELIQENAGPAAFLGWILSGFVCLLSGYAFMELSTRIPSAGSCYAYSYHALGELPAMIAASFLTLEYGISGAGVARSWATKVHEAFSIPNWLNLNHANLIGCTLHAICVVIVLLGIKMGKPFINAMTTIKVAVVLFMIIAGSIFIKIENLTPLIPKEFGMSGIMIAASKGFFGYAGFDEVCCLAGEAKNPRRNMPLALLGVILGSMILTSLATFVLSGMVKYNAPTDIISFGYAFQQNHLRWAQYLVQIGEIVTLPIVALVCFLSQPRLHFAMAIDGLLPPIFAQVDSAGSLFYNTLISGVILTLVALFITFETLWELINLGMLFSFILVNASLIIVRVDELSKMTKVTEQRTVKSFWDKMSPISFVWAFILSSGISLFIFVKSTCIYGKIFSLVPAFVAVLLLLNFYRKFFYGKSQIPSKDYRAPLVPWIPAFAICINWYLIAQSTMQEFLYEIIWILAVIIVYFFYGYQHSKRRTAEVYIENGTAPNSSSQPGAKKSCITQIQESSDYLKLDTSRNSMKK